MKKFTLADVIPVVREIVAEHPDTYTYRHRVRDLGVTGYPDCTYLIKTATGSYTPGCLVGVVLDRMGVALPDPTLRWNRERIDLVTGVLGLTMAASSEPVDFDIPARRFLSRLQDEQDMGRSWRKALDLALVEAGGSDR